MKDTEIDIAEFNVLRIERGVDKNGQRQITLAVAAAPVVWRETITFQCSEDYIRVLDGLLRLRDTIETLKPKVAA